MKPTLATAGRSAVEGAIFAQVETNSRNLVEMFHGKYPSSEITPAAYVCYAASERVSQIQAELTSTNASNLPAIVIKDRTVHLLDQATCNSAIEKRNLI